MAQILFYLLAGVTVAATLLAISEKHPVHAIVYLVTSFFSLAVIFFLLAAPLVAAFEVIIYAGAVMVLFLFVVMMLDLGSPRDARRPTLVHCLPALLFAGISGGSLLLLLALGQAAPERRGEVAGIGEFAVALFHNHGLAIEIISLQLLFAVVGALTLARRRKS